ncbi:MAG: cation-transporting P-type ATPase [Anaerolineae bacterium]|nr:cation-transporting P-type ATPase [Anaerolineae bacterium]
MDSNDRQPGPFPTWWATEPAKLARETGSDLSQGLSPEQVGRNRQRYGHNRFEERGPASLWTLAWESVRSPMMLLLLAIAGISLLLGQFREAIAMAVVVALYVGVHLLNKARSDRTMARLRQIQAPRVRVLRQGTVHEIRAGEVVVGDVLRLQPGTRIPADGRLISSAGLLVQESALTGESAPVHKDAEAEVGAGTPLAERPTAVYRGTTVLDGQGKALVMAVGERTELGRVAELAAGAAEEPTPLQQEMDSLAHTLAYVALGISLLIPALGLLRGFGLEEMVLTWLSLTFLMVPGQPPIIIAMALALAAIELARKGVIVRRLHGAETLGAVTVVLSDKTGTMTENRMVLESVLLPDGQVLPVKADKSRRLSRFFDAALLAIPEDTNDPTDQALVRAAIDLQDVDLPQRGGLVDQVGFSRAGAYRALVYQREGQSRVFVAGRPQTLLERSERRETGDGAIAWEPEDRQQLKAEIEALGAKGKRLAAYGYRKGRLDAGALEGLVFAGVAVIGDPIRPEVGQAVDELRQAGIRVAMVTGDIGPTPAYVAGQVGLDGDQRVEGGELEGQPAEGYEAAVQRANVFARTTPEQKLRLVQALQRLGEVVAVTGDGVNDAPALRTAHVGVAMGERGTDVAREAADLVLTDDNFARLTDGVAIGRKAFDNFSKGITYYLSAKAILLSIFVVPLVAGSPFPLAPLQIIATELLMDLASSTIFVTEEAEPGLLRRRPRQRSGFLSWQVAGRIARNSVGLVAAILAVYFGSLAWGYGLDSARTAAFATWLLGHIVLAMNLKQSRTPLLKQGLLSNRFAAGWLVGMILLVLAMTLLEPVRSVLHTTALSGRQWLVVGAGALLASGWIEVAKWLRLRRDAG